MPLPKEPFTIHGGCNCKAVRYKVSAPDWTDRPRTPYCTPGVDIGDVRIPAIYVDHCNDCRRATGAVLPMWLVCVEKTVQISAVPHSEAAEGPFQIAATDREWVAASEALDFQNPALQTQHLSVYKSTPKRSRWFCSRCGTMFAYTVDPGVAPPDRPAMVDICLGTIDREDLEMDSMHPERMMWCEKGVPWIRKWATGGAGGIPEHPLTKVDILVKEGK